MSRSLYKEIVSTAYLMNAIKLLSGLKLNAAAASSGAGVAAGVPASTIAAPQVPVPADVPVKANVSNVLSIPLPLPLPPPPLPPVQKVDYRLKVMFCGTYPIGQSNGYSRVVYYIAKFLGLKKSET